MDLEERKKEEQQIEQGVVRIVGKKKAMISELPLPPSPHPKEEGEKKEEIVVVVEKEGEKKEEVVVVVEKEEKTFEIKQDLEEKETVMVAEEKKVEKISAQVVVVAKEEKTTEIEGVKPIEDVKKELIDAMENEEATVDYMGDVDEEIEEIINQNTPVAQTRLINLRHPKPKSIPNKPQRQLKLLQSQYTYLSTSTHVDQPRSKTPTTRTPTRLRPHTKTLVALKSQSHIIEKRSAAQSPHPVPQSIQLLELGGSFLPHKDFETWLASKGEGARADTPSPETMIIRRKKIIPPHQNTSSIRIGGEIQKFKSFRSKKVIIKPIPDNTPSSLAKIRNRQRLFVDEQDQEWDNLWNDGVEALGRSVTTVALLTPPPYQPMQRLATTLTPTPYQPMQRLATTPTGGNNKGKRKIKRKKSNPLRLKSPETVDLENDDDDNVLGWERESEIDL